MDGNHKLNISKILKALKYFFYEKVKTIVNYTELKYIQKKNSKEKSSSQQQ